MAMWLTLGVPAEGLEHVGGLADGSFCFLEHIEEKTELAQEASLTDAGGSRML
jgi:hypothetical protein